ALRVNLPRGERALDEARLSGADAHRFDGDVFFDADRSVRRLDLGVVAGVLDHEIARRTDRKLALAVHADLGSARDDHGWEIRLVGGCSHFTTSFSRGTPWAVDRGLCILCS